MKKGDHLFLVDGSGYIFRAYHALPPLNRKSDGLPTNAVLGFCNMVWKLMQDAKTTDVGVAPTHFAVIFDYSSKTFRNELYDQYKANRTAPPEDLIPQFSLIRQATVALGLPCIEKEGFEADDLIATYSRLACEVEADTTIVSSDKDLMQLVGATVAMYDPIKDKRIGIPEVIEKWGVPPEKMIDLQALLGDPVDNVPGVRGVGEKAAAQLLSELPSVLQLVGDDADPADVQTDFTQRRDTILSELQKTGGAKFNPNSPAQVGAALTKLGVGDLGYDKKGAPVAKSEDVDRLASQNNDVGRFCRQVARYKALENSLSKAIPAILADPESVLVSRSLVTLKNDVPLGDGEALDDLVLQPVNGPALVGFLKTMEFTTLTRRVAEATGTDASAVEGASVTVDTTDMHGPDVGFPVAADGGRTAVKKAEKGEPTPPGSTSSSLPLKGEGTTPAQLAKARADAAGTGKFDATAYLTIRDVQTLSDWVAGAAEAGVVSIDTAVTSFDPMQAEICGFTLATAPGRAAYVPVAHRTGATDLLGGGHTEGQVTVREALALLKPLLESAAVLKIGHNIKVDLVVLARYGVALAPVDDIMLMSYALDGGTQGGHGRDELAQKVLGHTTIEYKSLTGTGKSAIGFDQVAIEKATGYMAERADVTLRLWQVLKPRLPTKSVVSVYERLERPLIPVLARMEQHGIAIDRQILSRLSGELAQGSARLEDEIYAVAGEKFTIGSPKQLGDILFDKMKLPGGSKTKTGQWSTTAQVLEELAAEGHELPRKIVDWRQMTKLKSTYTDALPGYVNPETKRVHTSYALAATTTGRLSSSEPNLQNIPIRTAEGRKIRTAFIAEKGHKLISADYSQIELRILAHVADIPRLKQAFAEDADIHAATASEMFNTPVAGMPREIRNRAKAINFGIIYGISAFGLANQLSIPREEASDYIKRYFERFPGIRDYIEATKEFARQHGYVETIFGRRVHYPEIRSSNPSIRAFNERASTNARLQGTAADIIRRAMIRMDEALAAEKLAARMLLQVHDELIFETVDDEVERTLPVIRRVMENAPMPAVALSVPLRVDARAADNWDEAH